MRKGPETPDYIRRIANARDGLLNGFLFRTPAWSLVSLIGSEQLGVRGFAGRLVASGIVTLVSLVAELAIFNFRVRPTFQEFQRSRVHSPDETGYALF